jgi:hypothetical protein
VFRNWYLTMNENVELGRGVTDLRLGREDVTITSCHSEACETNRAITVLTFCVESHKCQATQIRE